MNAKAKKVAGTTVLMIVGLGVGLYLAPLATSSQRSNGYYGGNEAYVEPPSAWKDYPRATLTNTDRLKERPGNFQILAAIGQFLDESYSIEPNPTNLAFPINFNGKTYESRGDLDHDRSVEHDEALQSGKDLYNPRRLSNIDVHDIKFVELAKGESVEFDGEPRSGQFKWVREKHPGRMIVAYLNVTKSSLKSDEATGGSDAPYEMVMAFAHGGNRWRLCWIND